MYIAQSSSRYFSLILHTTHHGITTRFYHRSGQFLLNNNNENYSVIGEQSLVSGGSWTPLTEKLSSGIFTLYRRGQNKSTESQTFIRQVLLTEKNQVLSHIIQSQSVALVFQFCLGNLWQLQFRFGWQNSRAVAKGVQWVQLHRLLREKAPLHPQFRCHGCNLCLENPPNFLLQGCTHRLNWFYQSWPHFARRVAHPPPIKRAGYDPTEQLSQVHHWGQPTSSGSRSTSTAFSALSEAWERTLIHS